MKIKKIILLLSILIAVSVLYVYISYKSYYNGYFDSEKIIADNIYINTELVLKSNFSDNIKKGIITNIFAVANAEIMLLNLSDNEMFCEKISEYKKTYTLYKLEIPVNKKRYLFIYKTGLKII